MWVEGSGVRPMNNVIQFPQRREPVETATAVNAGPKTLFIHIKNTTMIVHLAAQRSMPATGDRVGSS